MTKTFDFGTLRTKRERPQLIQVCIKTTILGFTQFVFLYKELIYVPIEVLEFPLWMLVRSHP